MGSRIRKFCGLARKLAFVNAMALVTFTLTPASALAVTCTEGTLNASNAGFLAPDTDYAFPLEYTGRNYKITGFTLRVQKGVSGNPKWTVGVVQMTTNPIAVTSVLGQCQGGGSNGSGSFDATCNLATPVTVSLQNSTTTKIGLQVQVSVASWAWSLSTNDKDVVTVAESYANGNMTGLATTTGGALRPQMQMTYEPVYYSVPTSSVPRAALTNTSTHLVRLAGGTTNTTTTTVCHSAIAVPDSLVWDSTNGVLRRIGTPFTGPATIANATAAASMPYPTQRAVWRNSRGLQYYYAIVQTSGTGLVLYKSSDAVTWSSVSTLSANTDYSASVYPYDDGTQQVVYVAYSYNGGWNSGKKIYYRRLLIPDSASSPTVGAEQDTGKAGGAAQITRDRNGYVHITQWGNGSTTQDEVSIYGTTAVNPGDAPSWSASTTVRNHAGSTSTSNAVQSVPFSSGNILGIIFNNQNSTSNDFYGRDVSAFDGTTYTFAAAASSIHASGATGAHPFSVVVDDSNIAHLALQSSAGTVGVVYYKATGASSVTAWNAAVYVTGETPTTVSLALDRSRATDRLYLFYHTSTETKIRWKYIDVNSSSWSSFSSLPDSLGANVDAIQIADSAVSSTIPFIYVKQTSTFATRASSFTPQ